MTNKTNINTFFVDKSTVSGAMEMQIVKCICVKFRRGIVRYSGIQIFRVNYGSQVHTEIQLLFCCGIFERLHT